VLLAFVPGVDEPGERAALGITNHDRSASMDESISLCRRFWSGEAVVHTSDRFVYNGLQLRPTPVQEPLEIWLGGRGPAALRRAGRLSDGWLGAGVSPIDCVGACERINEAANDAGRVIDAEHFGMSIPYGRVAPAPALVERIAQRSPHSDINDLLPIGPEHLRDLVGRYADSGVSKFVVRSMGPVTDWDDELGHLASVVLALQT
jgi:alkanesulfonate monooxygenase SsuD/methylene tetrahydromethanopterin reductase-like flavin-dependent oxidoreductase (luciferase family)